MSREPWGFIKNEQERKRRIQMASWASWGQEDSAWALAGLGMMGACAAWALVNGLNWETFEGFFFPCFFFFFGCLLFFCQIVEEKLDRRTALIESLLLLADAGKAKDFSWVNLEDEAQMGAIEKGAWLRVKSAFFGKRAAVQSQAKEIEKVLEAPCAKSASAFAAKRI